MYKYIQRGWRNLSIHFSWLEMCGTANEKSRKSPTKLTRRWGSITSNRKFTIFIFLGCVFLLLSNVSLVYHPIGDYLKALLAGEEDGLFEVGRDDAKVSRIAAGGNVTC